MNKKLQILANPPPTPSSSRYNSGSLSRRSMHGTLTRTMSVQTVDGVGLGDVMESAVGSLAALARASMINRDEILETNVAELAKK